MTEETEKRDEPLATGWMKAKTEKHEEALRTRFPEGDKGVRTFLRFLIYLPVFFYVHHLIIPAYWFPILSFHSDWLSPDYQPEHLFYYLPLSDLVAAYFFALAASLALAQPLLRGWKRWGLAIIGPAVVLVPANMPFWSFSYESSAGFKLVPYVAAANLLFISTLAVEGALFAAMAALIGGWLTKPVPYTASWTRIAIRVVGIAVPIAAFMIWVAKGWLIWHLLALVLGLLLHIFDFSQGLRTMF
ncbi:MAG: hypothetical protein LBR29_08100 [Methylobacteriaceae bacterium]|jgi:hypothetical protein|nr:hypothetical protein [Methylobacteriaceae bacterium]